MAGEVTLFLVAGVAAGAVNAVAGGGSLISFPALVYAGLPPLSANVSSTVALWPGYAGAAAGFRQELRGTARRIRAMSLVAMCGGAAGAALLLTTPVAVFERLAPFLVIFASLLLAATGLPTDAAEEPAPADRQNAWGMAGLFLTGVYGGYFGGGLGVLLLGVLALSVRENLLRLTAYKSVLSLVINSVAVLTFAVAGPVRWDVVALMAPAAVAGGFAGARAARKVRPALLRAVVVVFGLVAGIALWLG